MWGPAAGTSAPERAGGAGRRSGPVSYTHLYTAYDTQKIKAYYNYYAGYPDMLEKASIFSALQLYLDFINLFLYLLRFLGKSRN